MKHDRKNAFLWHLSVILLASQMASAQAAPPSEAPKALRLCVPTQPCQNLMWTEGKYLGSLDGNSTPIASYSVVQWDASAVVISGTSLKKVPLMGYLTAVYRGKAGVGRLEDALLEWHFGKTSGTGPFQLTWEAKPLTASTELVPLSQTGTPTTPVKPPIATPNSMPLGSPTVAHDPPKPTDQDTPALDVVIRNPEPPPSGLPVILYECDVEPAARPCGVWRWTGKAYEGFWSNGAVARMVVTAKSSSLLIRRIDPKGTRSGLSATYTGKWDGKKLTDGKFTWVWDGKTAVYEWTASSEMPENCYLKIDVAATHTRYDDYAFLVTNRYDAAVTALVLRANGYDAGPAAFIDYRLGGVAPLKKGESRSAGSGRIPNLTAAAVLFSDGQEWGDSRAIERLKAGRKAALEKLKSAIAGQGEFANKTVEEIETRKTGLLADTEQEKTLHAYLPEVVPPETHAAANLVHILDTPEGTSTGTVGVKVSEAESAKLVRKKVDPTYSPLMKSARMEGTVKLEFTVTDTGQVADIKILSKPQRLLDDMATDSLRRWQFEPYMVDGHPMAMRTTTDVKFQLIHLQEHSSTEDAVPVSPDESEKLLVRKIAPVYPPLAKSQGIQGNVSFEFTVTIEGRVTDIQFLRGEPHLVNAAKEALAQWQYKPYLVGGHPVAMRTMTDFRFALN